MANLWYPPPLICFVICFLVILIMTTGISIEKDKRVLKLVHPGGHVETHERAVVASQIIKKNPRHCITRPDVFKFPWFVVAPTSLLKPGNVFFIVPNRTIYRLLQAYSDYNHKPPMHPFRDDDDNDNGHCLRDRPFDEDNDLSMTLTDESELNGCENVETTLKSCLRKDKGNGLSSGGGSKVTFCLPEEHHEDYSRKKLVRYPQTPKHYKFSSNHLPCDVLPYCDLAI